MLKRIGVHQLNFGMHLKKFCGLWMDHPFLRTDFVLLDAQDLQTIFASSNKEVWIDCAKGIDIVVGESAVLEVALVLPVEVDR